MIRSKRSQHQRCRRRYFAVAIVLFMRSTTTMTSRPMCAVVFAFGAGVLNMVCITSHCCCCEMLCSALLVSVRSILIHCVCAMKVKHRRRRNATTTFVACGIAVSAMVCVCLYMFETQRNRWMCRLDHVGDLIKSTAQQILVIEPCYNHIFSNAESVHILIRNFRDHGTKSMNIDWLDANTQRSMFQNDTSFVWFTESGFQQHRVTKSKIGPCHINTLNRRTLIIAFVDDGCLRLSHWNSVEQR
mmetsp:Transcript_39955/g.65503  ORF Transcript_39955/g.65503 Transcript_39955/m.65503 type:complete len:244 (-) Transcript_39955:116-847(-)